MEEKEQHGAEISIVMPAFRMGGYITEALRSVGEQSFRGWEVVVVDDHGPDDGTRQAVEAFGAHHPLNPVRFIRHPENKGVAAARNTGAGSAKGEFLAFLDPDDLWLPNHLRDLFGRFQEDPGIAVAAGPVEIFSDAPEGGATRVSALSGWQRDRFPASLALYNFIQPSAALIRASAFTAVGGFDENRSIEHIEDYDLWIRLVSQGFRFGFLDRPSSRYRQHSAGATNDGARMRRLDEILRTRHPAFFGRHQAMLIRSLLGEMATLKGELVAMRIAGNGPLIRTAMAMDKGLRRVFRALMR